MFYETGCSDVTKNVYYGEVVIMQFFVNCDHITKEN